MKYTVITFDALGNQTKEQVEAKSMAKAAGRRPYCLVVNPDGKFARYRNGDKMQGVPKINKIWRDGGLHYLATFFAKHQEVHKDNQFLGIKIREQEYKPKPVKPLPRVEVVGYNEYIQDNEKWKKISESLNYSISAKSAEKQEPPTATTASLDATSDLAHSMALKTLNESVDNAIAKAKLTGGNIGQTSGKDNASDTEGNT